MHRKTPTNLIKRAPVVVVMGHIDHGKSTLLDYIRKTNIVADEAGGITQHVGAYQAKHKSADGIEHIITFLDTPGHEAFCGIRERGTKAADIAILVVSAEDGVKPQTIEALKNIKAENIPYIVAINKIDKPNADINRTKQSLGENEIYVEGWGGDIPCVPISALNGTGVSELLDMVILVSELENLTYDPKKKAEGIVIESEKDSRQGISATLLITDGTLTTGTFVVAGPAFSPIRYISDCDSKKVDSATASTPVQVTGWNEIPPCGIQFQICATKKEAEEIMSEYISEIKIAETKKSPNTASNINTTNNEEQAPQFVVLPLIIKADVIGSLEGIEHELDKISHEKVKIKIVSDGIGPINENDVKTAMSDSNITLIGFNAEPDAKASAIIERAPSPILIKNFSIIYELVEYIKNTLLSKVPKEYIEEVMGRAKILAIFSKEKNKQIAGGKVETGLLSSGNEVKITRRETEIGRGKIRELQEKKLRADEVAEGHEFGVMIEAKTEIAVGDRIEAVRMVEKTQ